MYNPNYRYILYARKSTESEDRQALSIQSQIDKVKAKFPDINIVRLFKESKSAFKPDERADFQEMISIIKDGKADGIVAYHPDRISRNEIDAATVTYLTRTGVIKDLQFTSYNFDNTPDGIMQLQTALSQSQYSSSKLSIDVKRGLNDKLQMGIRPNRVPQGWTNDYISPKGMKTIGVDQKRFSVLRKSWDMVLSGLHTPPQALKRLNNEWGYRTRKTKRMGGKPMSRSGIYKMFTNPFYAGQIRQQDGTWTVATHKAMVTLIEYDRVQRLLGRKGNPRAKHYDYCYKPLLTCGDCQGCITAETKRKIIKSTGEQKEYIFYHCTHNKDENCRQGSIEERELTDMMEVEMQKYTIIPQFKDWALEMLNKYNDAEINQRRRLHEMQTATILQTQKEIDSLTQMRYRELLSDEEYLQQKNPLLRQLKKLQEELNDTHARAEQWLELTEKTFEFITYAAHHFKEDDFEKKRTILAGFGSNFLIKDKQLVMQPHEWLIPIGEEYKQLEAAYLKLEPAQSSSTSIENIHLEPIRLSWRRGGDSNPRADLRRPTGLANPPLQPLEYLSILGLPAQTNQ